MASALTEAHITAEQRLRAIVVAEVSTAWSILPRHNEEDIPEWLARVLPVVSAGQRQSVALTQAYLARALHRPPASIDPERLIGRHARRGTPPEDVYRRPFVKLWTGLKQGKPFDEASAAGLAQATGSAAMDVQLAARETFAAVQAEDDAIYGYQRVADGDACDFCVELDGAYVKSGDAMPLHPNCGCSLEPLSEPHPRAASLPDGVAVNEHGELGPILGDPAHSFTTESELD